MHYKYRYKLVWNIPYNFIFDYMYCKCIIIILVLYAICFFMFLYNKKPNKNKKKLKNQFHEVTFFCILVVVVKYLHTHLNCS